MTIGKVLRALRTPFTLLVLLAILGFAAWWGYQQVIAPIPPTPPAPCVPQAIESGKLQSSQVTVRIYNGGGKRGQASDVAANLRGKGFNVTVVDNTDEAITGTVIVVQDKDNPEAKLVQAYFPESKIREDPTRVDRVVQVLVGSEYKGFNSKASKSLKLDDATICLPELSTEG